MGNQKKTLTNREWFNKYSKKFFKHDNLVLFAREKSEQYMNLSCDHIYSVLVKISRLIYFELKSFECQNDSKLLLAIQRLDQIIVNRAIFDEKSRSFNLPILSSLNAGDLKSIEWYLFDKAEAIGPNHTLLENVNNVADYREVIKEIIKEVATEYLRNFYNYLITKPVLSETQTLIANTIKSALEQWQQTTNENNAENSQLDPAHLSSSAPQPVERSGLTPTSPHAS